MNLVSSMDYGCFLCRDGDHNETIDPLFPVPSMLGKTIFPYSFRESYIRISSVGANFLQQCLSPILSTRRHHLNGITDSLITAFLHLQCICIVDTGVTITIIIFLLL